MQLRHGRTCVGSAALVALLAVMHQSTAVAAPPADAPTVETDYAADLPRLPQVSAAVARDTLVDAPGFALELMAAEPLVASPVAIAWDEDGALFVAEMRGSSEDQGERIGRIRLLHDEDGDGRPDRATVYAEGLAWPTAVCCWDGGVFVGDAPLESRSCGVTAAATSPGCSSWVPWGATSSIANGSCGTGPACGRNASTRHPSSWPRATPGFDRCSSQCAGWRPLDHRHAA